MSLTISQLPVGVVGRLSDIIPLTQGSSAPGAGATRGVTTAKILGSNGLVFAGDPAFGVKADGSTDDTSSWTAALGYASATGACVIPPLGVSLVSSITVPPNVAIIGRNVESYNVANGYGSGTLGSVISGTSATLPAVIMSLNSQIYNMKIDGNPAQSCIKLASSANPGTIQLYDVDVFGGLIGIDCAGVPAYGIVNNCRIHECGTGLANGTDLSITNNIITNCTTAGITLLGSNKRVLITGNRIDTCGININLSGTSSASFVNNVTITGNLLQDSSGNNILLNFCHNVTVTGNEIGCAGRGQSGTPGNASDANFQIANSSACVINGNSTWVGTDNNAYIGPYYAVYDGGGNTNCLISSNILPYHNNASSSTSGPINITTTFNLASALNVTYWTATN